MTGWIKYNDSREGSVILLNLDMATRFIHFTKFKRILVHFGGSHTNIQHEVDPNAYNKVLEYMRKIEEQIK
jgi:hypothetical protein